MDMDHGSHGSGSDGGGACKISMLWNWTTIDACFLAPDWHVRSTGVFVASCLGAALLSVGLEALRRGSREYDDYLVRGFRARAAASVAADDYGFGYGDVGTRVPRAARFRPDAGQQLVRAGLHVAAFGVAYVLMLLAMAYNGYVILCILAGAGIGKFLCDWTATTVVVGGGGGGVGSGSGSGSDVRADGVRGNKMGGRMVDEPTLCCG